jgi:hypothetical protein
MSQLFQKDRRTIQEHLRNIFADGEQNEDTVCRKFQHTAAELIMKRADARKGDMGLTSWKNAPHGKIIKTDVSIAKNYLSKLELSELNEIVTMYLDYAHRQARKYVPMTMDDWKTKLDVFLELNDEVIGDGIGKVTHEIAKTFAESEFEKYRIIQDKTYVSDFDRLVEQSKEFEAE